VDDVASTVRMPSVVEELSHLIRRVGVVILLHIGVLGIVLTGGNALEWALVLPIATLRGLVVTIGYHRYFSHRSFKTSRVGQFLLAVLCCLNLQNGPLWWAAVHRHHHRHSDRSEDYHSPIRGGFFFGHFGWLFRKTAPPSQEHIGDLLRFPELVWLERFWILPGALVAFACWRIGGWSTVCVVFCLTTVLTLQMTFLVNSASHLFGAQPYPTSDSSRNSYLIAILTLGDGWHNNHHHYPHAAQAGFQWWEADLSYRVIQLLSGVGLVWDVRTVPAHKLNARMKPNSILLVGEEAQCSSHQS
jgi:stearoyl-CoA desaturase (delta-9 desaturase)